MSFAAIAIDPVMLLAALAAVFALLSFIVVLRQEKAGEQLRLTLEDTLHGHRIEAEATRAFLTEATERVGTQTAERLALLHGAVGTGIETLRTTHAKDQGELRLTIEAKLAEMRNATAERLAEIQRTVNEQLHEAVEKQMTASFARVVEQFAAVQKAVGDVQAITGQIGDIKRLFANVKTRGGWGETQIKIILDDILPPGAYETNMKMREDSDEAVEFAIRMPMRGETQPWLAVDAKFPIEDYERLVAASETGDAEGERAATAALERRIKLEARKIAGKYINPPVTVEFAVLYLPTDALFTEVARIPGLIDSIGQECRVVVLGPSLFPAMLRTIQLGFVTLSLEQKAGLIADLLSATRGEMMRMDEVLDRLAKQAASFGNTIDRARTRSRQMGRKLRSVGIMDRGEAALVLDLEGEEDEVA